MKTYVHIKAEIAKLERQAEAALKQERAGVITRIKQAIDIYGFTARDLGLGGKGKSRASARAVSTATPTTTTTVGVAKYRDPKTGKTWTGRGKPPNWIKDVKNREAFLISPASDAGSPAATSGRGAPAKGARAQRRTGRRKAAKTTTRSARRAAIAPAVQVESGAATA
jgi:DNA-binding protein H-NS